MNDMPLECGECRRVTLLDGATILSKLTQSSQVKIIECPCGQYQFVLSAVIRRAEKAAEIKGAKKSDCEFRKMSILEWGQ
jgi:hypothetical protein